VRETFYRLDISRYEPGSYKWNVAVVHATEQEPYWEPLSDDSQAWTFEVATKDHGNGDGGQTPSPIK
jgi:hypothetical protein